MYVYIYSRVGVDSPDRQRAGFETNVYIYTYKHTGSDATVLAGKELGVRTLAYYPLAMGLLTGKLLPQRFRGKGDPR